MSIPTEIKKSSPTELTIYWDDDHTSVFPIKYLRFECTCAGCIDEVTGKRIIREETIPLNISISNAKHVGKYGVQFYFSDNHSTGIYTWKHLRLLCHCPECSKN